MPVSVRYHIRAPRAEREERGCKGSTPGDRPNLNIASLSALLKAEKYFPKKSYSQLSISRSKQAQA
jgi:hypothetical protein